MHLSLRLFKPDAVDEITRLKASLYRNQNEIKEREQQSPAIVEQHTYWKNNMLHRPRMRLEAGGW
jgi:hypothetical protein